MSPRTDEPLDEWWGRPHSVAPIDKLDTTRPSVARMYDYFLGGKDNYTVDREAAVRVEEAAPSLPRAARRNRAFLRRAVQFCAVNAGIRQFIDIGTGIPTSPNVSEIVGAVHHNPVVVGVDNDPIVLAHGRALMNGIHLIEGDLRDPHAVLADPELNDLIDWAEPVAC